MRIGGLEAGGTKMVCAVGNEKGEVLERISIPTLTPDETFPEMISYYKEKKIDALGIGSFGPVDLDKKSLTYGSITKTPKPGWSGINFVKRMQDALEVPVGFDTDVNAAVLGEVTYGAAKGCDPAIYITVGTGVGVGVYANGALVHGLVHPEGGHILLQKDSKDTYQGCCPFHRNCVEGLASGPAITGRYGREAKLLADNPDVWELESEYLAQAIVNYIMMYSPQKIILWGGVMHQTGLFPMIREKVKVKMNGYVNHPMILQYMDDYIIPPGLGENPGVLGAVKLGLSALEADKKAV